MTLSLATTSETRRAASQTRSGRSWSKCSGKLCERAAHHTRNHSPQNPSRARLPAPFASPRFIVRSRVDLEPHRSQSPRFDASSARHRESTLPTRTAPPPRPRAIRSRRHPARASRTTSRRRSTDSHPSRVRERIKTVRQPTAATPRPQHDSSAPERKSSRGRPRVAPGPRRASLALASRESDRIEPRRGGAAATTRIVRGASDSTTRATTRIVRRANGE